MHGATRTVLRIDAKSMRGRAVAASRSCSDISDALYVFSAEGTMTAAEMGAAGQRLRRVRLREAGCRHVRLVSCLVSCSCCPGHTACAWRCPKPQCALMRLWVLGCQAGRELRTPARTAVGSEVQQVYSLPSRVDEVCKAADYSLRQHARKSSKLKPQLRMSRTAKIFHAQCRFPLQTASLEGVC